MKANGAIVSMAIAMLTLAVASTSGSEDVVAYNTDNLVRLHVVGNSNSPKDQAVKLLVRDAILNEGRSFMSSALTKEEALQSLAQETDRLEEAAARAVKEAGFCGEVKVELAKRLFPAVTYKETSLPAGEYDAVTVTIGEGEGDNWWCVMFPPLCLVDAVVEQNGDEGDEDPVPAFLFPDKIRLLSGGKGWLDTLRNVWVQDLEGVSAPEG